MILVILDGVNPNDLPEDQQDYFVNKIKESLGEQQLEIVKYPHSWTIYIDMQQDEDNNDD